jgi:hypothetical protein
MTPRRDSEKEGGKSQRCRREKIGIDFCLAGSTTYDDLNLSVGRQESIHEDYSLIDICIDMKRREAKVSDVGGRK